MNGENHTLVLQNPARPIQLHKLHLYEDENQAMSAALSVQKVLTHSGLMNRDMPLFYVEHKREVVAAMSSNGKWWEHQRAAGGRVIPTSTPYSLKHEPIAGVLPQNLSYTLPDWIFTWPVSARGR